MTTFLVTTNSLNPYLVDKDNGQPLSNGTVQFWKDAQRTDPKPVYQKVATGADPVTGNPVYEFVELPNPLTLSAVGTFMDGAGNNIAVYYFPFEGVPDNSTGVVELYYIAVFNSLGVQQFVREGWPGSGVEEFIINGDGGGGENMLSNPQFVDINFSQDIGFSYTSAGAGSVVIPLAPKWNLNVTFTGVGTVTATRTAIAGSAHVVTNPPYVLTVTGGANVSAITLVQRLEHNPGIWSPITNGEQGYLASYFILASGSAATMSYAPSVGAPTELLAANNATASYVGYSNTIQLDPSANTDTGSTGYVDISIALNAAGTTTISSIQVLPLNALVEGIDFIQESVNRQKDHLFNYYNSLLQFKPIPSYLVGWDFGYNPAQFLGSSVGPLAVGANKSFYAWDQTIIFQSADSGVAITRGSAGTAGSLRITAAVDTQFAVIQYIPTLTAARILYERIAVNMAATTDMATIPFTISLWRTNDVSLPSCVTSNNSIVLTLNANGKPATRNGTWTEIPRSNLGDARGNLVPSNFDNYGFSGWDDTTALAANSVTFLAIVVGFGTLTATKSVEIDSISLCSGDIPTQPAAETFDQVFRQCCYYYQKSFDYNTVPAQNIGTGTGEYIYVPALPGAAIADAPTILLPVSMYSAPNVITYSTSEATNQVWDADLIAPCSLTSVTNIFPKGFVITCTGNAGSSAGNRFSVHWSADARLGQ